MDHPVDSLTSSQSSGPSGRLRQNHYNTIPEDHPASASEAGHTNNPDGPNGPNSPGDPGFCLTQTQYAEWRKQRGYPGYTQASVSNAISSGKLRRSVLWLGNRKMLINPVIADLEWESRVRFTGSRAHRGRDASPPAGQVNPEWVDTDSSQSWQPAAGTGFNPQPPLQSRLEPLPELTPHPATTRHQERHAPGFQPTAYQPTAYQPPATSRMLSISDSKEEILAAEARIKKARAEKEELALAERRGELLRAQEVEEWHARIIREIRDHMMSFASDWAGEIAAKLEVSNKLVFEVLDWAVREHLKWKSKLLAAGQPDNRDAQVRNAQVRNDTVGES